MGKKWWKKKVGSKKVREKNQKIKKKSRVEKSKQAVVEVASELLFGLVQNASEIWFDNVRHITNSLETNFEHYLMNSCYARLD